MEQKAIEKFGDDNADPKWNAIDGTIKKWRGEVECRLGGHIVGPLDLPS